MIGCQLITDDKRVRAMAKKAGVWRPLRDARQRGQTCVVLHGMTIFGAFHDGYAAFVATTPALFLEAFVRLSMQLGLQSPETIHDVTLH